MDTISPHADNSNIPSSKYCGGCKQTLAAICFSKDGYQPDGLAVRCRDCRKQFRKTHPEKPESPEYRKIRNERQRKKRDILVTKTCSECGLPYQDRNGIGKICPTCKTVRRKRFRPQTYIRCEHCNAPFLADHLSRKYCSYDCKKVAQKGRANAKRGKVYPHTQRASTLVCPSCGSRFRTVKNSKRYQQIYCSHACYLKERRVSHFEKRVMDLIASVGIPVERQVKRGKWSFDAAITNTSILLEADGAYWHSAEKVKDRDERKNQWCKDNGYVLMRVPELAFYDNPIKTINPIIARWEAHTGQTAVLLERVEASV